MLEREDELALLDTAITAAKAGEGGLVLIEADAGLGKTSLLRAAAEIADAAGCARLSARATELEHDFAYGLVRQLLEPVAVDADGAFAVLHGLYLRVSDLAATRPTVLLLDDLQWADVASLRFLSYLTPRLEGLPLAVIAATRPSAASDLARVAAAPETTHIRPRALSAAGVAELCGGASEFAAACFEATGGNPFYLAALLRETEGLAADAVRGIGPAEVARAVLLRLADAPTAATPVLRAAAVLGDGASIAELARFTTLEETAVRDAADALAALDLLAPDAPVAFAHPIVREAVLADIGPHERGAAHARAAELLAQDGAASERIAAQIVAAPPAADRERVALLRRAADDALAGGAPSAAVAWLTRALDEPPEPALRGELLLELGSAELRLGAPTAAERFAAAATLFDDPAHAVRQQALALTIAAQADTAVAVLEPIIATVDDDLALVLEAELATCARQASAETRAAATRRLAARDAAGDTPGERLVRASLAFERAREAESDADAVALLQPVVDDERLLDDQDADIVGTIYDLLLGLLATDALDLADGVIARTLDTARARGSIPTVAYITARRGRAALLRGELAQAELDGRSALELLTVHEIGLGVPFARALVIESLVERGALDEAEALLGSEPIAPGMTRNFLLHARAGLRLAQGRAGEAHEDLVEFGSRDEDYGAASPLASRWRSAAALALGDDALAAEDLDRAQRWGSPRGIGVALRAHGLVSDDIEQLRAAVDVLAATPARLEHARASVDLGAALRRSGARAEARGALDEGVALARRCGADALAMRGLTELGAAGGRSGDPTGEGLEQLTVSERRVAELAAQGRSNPEIAQTLFVTRKTVETHLGHVYRKLDIKGRGELRDALSA